MTNLKLEQYLYYKQLDSYFLWLSLFLKPGSNTLVANIIELYISVIEIKLSM